MSGLCFDGTHLGSYNFNEVISSWWMPVAMETSGRKTATLYTYLKLLQPDNTVYRYPIILKRNTQKRIDQVLVDELKPLFGLHKMGTHRIRLHGVIRKMDSNYAWLVPTPNGVYRNAYLHETWSEYLIFKATYSQDQENVNFIPLPTLSKVAYYPFLSQNVKEGQRKLFQELQKIFVFRDLLRVGSSDANDVLLKCDPMASDEFKANFKAAIKHQDYADPHDNNKFKINLIALVSAYNTDNSVDRIVPISIDEMKIRTLTEHYKGLSDSVRSYCLQKSDIHAKALIHMLGLTAEDYAEKIEMLRGSMTKIIERIDEEYLWLVDNVITQIMDKVSIYYSVMVK